MKQAVLLFILLTIALFANSQEKLKSYKWMQNGIEFITEENLRIVESDHNFFRCDGNESSLWVKKINAYLTPIEREKYLMELISNLGYSVFGKVKKEMKDSVIVYFTRAENNKNYGYIFFFSDTLANNNLFSGYLTTGSKPKADIMSFIRFKTFQADPNFNPPTSKSAQNIYAETADDHAIIKESTNQDSLIIGKDIIYSEIKGLYQKYSPDINFLMNTYDKLPEKLGARKIGIHEDFTRYLSDTLDMRWLFQNSTFAHETYHNVCSWMSILQSIKKTKGNYTDRIYSYYLADSTFIHVERLNVPPASIVNKSFPVQFKGNELYSLYIYPSSLLNATQKDGIYTLLDEFGAYNVKLIWQNDLLQMYYDRGEANARFFGRYLINSIEAFYYSLSFNQYILHYFNILKSSSPELFKQLTEDFNFKKALVFQNQLLNKQIERFNSNKTKIRDSLAEEYVAFIENEKELKIDNWVWKNSEWEQVNKQIQYINSNIEYQLIAKEFGIAPITQIIIIKE